MTTDPPTSTPTSPNDPGGTLVTRRSRFSVSLIWLVPAIAVLLGLAVAVRSWTSTGPRIQVSFQTADGLEAGKTQVRFKSVVIGAVRAITLAEDQSHVVAEVQLAKSAKAFARAGSRFWVVRPRIGTSGVSGIDTLLSGAFIAADSGTSTEEQQAFTGLEQPPAVTQGEAGREFVLKARDLGSLSVGSPIYFRRIQVGRVSAIRLGERGRRITLSIFISAPYDRLVSADSRFWNASGLDVSLGANGLKVNTQSLATVIEGGIAFATPDEVRDPPEAAVNTEFDLVDDQATALAPPDGAPVRLVMRFPQSLRGMAVGAPIDFRGVELGRVTAIDLDYDDQAKEFSSVVNAVVYPQRLGRAYAKLAPEPDTGRGRRNTMLAALVGKGLRAQARAGNLLTGQLYIAIDFMPKAPKARFDARADPIEFPTVPGQFDKLQDQMAAIIDRVDKIPFDSIGRRLDASLASIDSTLQHVDHDLVPALQGTLRGVDTTLGAAGRTLDTANQALVTVQGTLGDDAPLRRELSRTLEQLQRSAISVRELTDYLGRHPDSLLRGRAEQPPVESPSR